MGAVLCTRIIHAMRGSIHAASALLQKLFLIFIYSCFCSYNFPQKAIGISHSCIAALRKNEDVYNNAV